MAENIAPLTTLPAWQALEAHYPKVRELHLRTLFADDPKRGERMTDRTSAAKRQLKHDSSTNTLIRRYRRSKERLHGR